MQMTVTKYDWPQVPWQGTACKACIRSHGRAQRAKHASGPMTHLVVSDLKHRLEGIRKQVLESGSYDLVHGNMTVTVKVVHCVSAQVVGGGMAGHSHHGGVPARVTVRPCLRSLQVRSLQSLTHLVSQPGARQVLSWNALSLQQHACKGICKGRSDA